MAITANKITACLSDEDFDKLLELSARMNVSRTEIVARGIRKLYEEGGSDGRQ
jgi:hypothetical protein